MKGLAVTTAIALVAGATGAVSAQEQYVSGSAGFNFQADSDNSGAFSRDFVTGAGGAVPAGTTLPEGASVGWTTEFDTGLFLSAAYGLKFQDTFRIEGEISYSSADVDAHTGVTAGGSAIGAADAAVLITGSAPLGVTVSDLVADGQGDVTSLGYAVNGYYDFAVQDTPFTAYIGGGLGIAELDVEYSPSGTQIVSDTEMVGFYQVMAGGAYAVSETTEVYAGYRWRQSGDAETDSALIPARLDVENASHILELGVRYTF